MRHKECAVWDSHKENAEMILRPSGVRVMYLRTMVRAFELSDVCRFRETRRFPWEGRQVPQWRELHCYYRSFVKPLLRRAWAFAFATLSASVVWSEITIALGRKPDLSPFSRLVRVTTKEWGVLVVVFIPLVSIQQSKQL